MSLSKQVPGNETINRKSLSDNILTELFEQSRQRRQSRISEELQKHIKRNELHPNRFRKLSKQIIVMNNTCRTMLDNLKLVNDNRRTESSLRSVILLAIYCRRISNAMATSSFIATPKTAAMEAWDFISNNKNQNNTDFTKSDYSRNSTQPGCYVPAWTKNILKKSPNDRNIDDIKALHRATVVLDKFNKKFTYSVRTAMCKTFEYEKFEKDRVILRSGQVAQNFYIIYSGSVFINRQEYDFKKMENVWRTEMALLKDNSSRKATVITREETEFLIVPRLFLQLCPQALDGEHELKFQVTSKMELFANWSMQALRSICTETKVSQYSANRVIIDDVASLSNTLYVCLEGNCSVLKKMQVKNKNGLLSVEEEKKSDPLYFYKSQPDPFFERKLNSELKHMMIKGADRRVPVDKIMLKTSKTATDSSKIPIEITIPKSAQQEHKSEVIYMCIGKLIPGEIFNLHEFLEPGLKQVILISNDCKLIEIERDVFFRYCTKKNLEKANLLAEKTKYASDYHLLKVYQNSISWKKYKHELVAGVLAKKKKRQKFKDSKTLLPDINHRKTYPAALKNMDELKIASYDGKKIDKAILSPRYSLTESLMKSF